MQNTGKYVNSIEIPVRWCDMDAFGHVNNSVYLSYFESVRIDWWNKVTPAEISFRDIGPVVINAYCTFFKAITYPETIIVNMFVGPAGRSSYECYYEIFSKTQSDIRYAEGSTKVVWVDRQLERSISLPDYMRQQLPDKIA